MTKMKWGRHFRSSHVMRWEEFAHPEPMSPAELRAKRKRDKRRRHEMKECLYPKGRVCAHPDCDTILSVYNPAPFCSLHGHPSYTAH